jgi:hypothetical protein
MTNPMSDQYVGVIFGCERSFGGDEDSFLGSFVNNDEDGVKTIRDGQRGYEIDGDILKGNWAWINGVKGSFGLVSMGFVGLARNAASNILFHISSKGVPAVMSLDQFDGFRDAGMASEWRIVILGYDLGSIMEYRYERGTNDDVGGGVDVWSRRPKARGNTDDVFIVMVSFVDIERSRKEVGFAMKSPRSVSEDHIVFH